MQLNMIIFRIPILLVLFSNVYSQLMDKDALKKLAEDPLIFNFRNVCYSSLENECFYNGPPFYHKKIRPFSAAPQEVNNVKFLLYTPSNPSRSFNLKPAAESIKKSPYDCNLDTKFLIHGFGPMKFDFFRKEMKDGLLTIGDFNVIAVDWREYSKPVFFQSVADTRTVAARTAILIKKLLEFCQGDPASFHVIGHSLGAQISGYIGKRVPGLGRITGLDPAGPSFQGLDKEARIDHTDANYVDILHTNSPDSGMEGIEGFGSMQLLGDQDFYVNNARVQPGCTIPPLLKTPPTQIDFTELLEANACSHVRANEIFIESITSTDCQFLAVKCDSYDDFQKGKCSSDDNPVAVAGYHSEPVSGLPPNTLFVLRTGDSKPFCVQDSNKPQKRKRGNLFSRLRG